MRRAGTEGTEGTGERRNSSIRSVSGTGSMAQCVDGSWDGSSGHPLIVGRSRVTCVQGSTIGGTRGAGGVREMRGDSDWFRDGLGGEQWCKVEVEVQRVTARGELLTKLSGLATLELARKVADSERDAV